MIFKIISRMKPVKYFCWKALPKWSAIPFQRWSNVGAISNAGVIWEQESKVEKRKFETSSKDLYFQYPQNKYPLRPPLLPNSFAPTVLPQNGGRSWTPSEQLQRLWFWWLFLMMILMAILMMNSTTFMVIFMTIFMRPVNHFFWKAWAVSPSTSDLLFPFRHCYPSLLFTLPFILFISSTHFAQNLHVL